MDPALDINIIFNIQVSYGFQNKILECIDIVWCENNDELNTHKDAPQLRVFFKFKMIVKILKGTV